MSEFGYWVLVAICTLGALAGTIPVLAGVYQYLLVGLSYKKTHLERCGYRLPRVSVIIPAWNEDSVVATTIDRLMSLKYPRESLRIYVVDDASSDQTPYITIEKGKEYPGNVFHIRRVAGGEGKAHTLNYGLDVLLSGDWTEAILIMDADVIYTENSLVQMARHLADPEIGAVTAYIKEGSASPNLVQRFVTFEYITATGCARRAQNVMGFLACLSGGAQLHTRENMLAIGGQIFSATLAEDTFTTFRTQLGGKKAIFEPNAIVYAEEPDDLVGLWKQRVRWARGNVQITGVYRKLWFDKRYHGAMGSFSMGWLWFAIFLMPIFQIVASLSLFGLFALDEGISWAVFEGLWLTSALTWVLVTFGSFVVDWESAKKSWFEGILFPGLISLSIILYTLCPPLLELVPEFLIPETGSTAHTVLVLFLYAWLSLGMLVAYLSKEVERRGKFPWLAKPLLLIGGYGAFLCAVTFGAYVKEYQGAELKWDKTIKTGKVG